MHSSAPCGSRHYARLEGPPSSRIIASNSGRPEPHTGLKGYITDKAELADVIKELKNCTPWKILDREPPLCKFFDSECQPRTENPYDSVTSALKALPPPRQSFDVAQPKQNSGTLRDLALETARQAAPQAALDDLD